MDVDGCPWRAHWDWKSALLSILVLSKVHGQRKRVVYLDWETEYECRYCLSVWIVCLFIWLCGQQPPPYIIQVQVTSREVRVSEASSFLFSLSAHVYLAHIGRKKKKTQANNEKCTDRMQPRKLSCTAHFLLFCFFLNITFSSDSAKEVFANALIKQMAKKEMNRSEARKNNGAPRWREAK